MVRHLAGAGIGLVAVPVLLLLTWWSLREQQLFVAAFIKGHGVLFLISFLLLGAVVGVLCGGRLVSPVASLVSGALLFLMCAAFWVPFIIGFRPVNLGEWFTRTVGYSPTLLVLSAVLLVASLWPSRWRTSSPVNPQPRPFPAQEVRP